eukprot:3513426-Rhodomonas_salina.1
MAVFMYRAGHRRQWSDSTCTVSNLHCLRATRPRLLTAKEQLRWSETEPTSRPLYSMARSWSVPMHSTSLPSGPRR